MANTLRGSIDAAGYKHVVLELIFLKSMFDRRVRPLYERVVSNEHESQTVATIHNAPLPKVAD